METPVGFTIIDGLINNSHQIIEWLESNEWQDSTYGSERTAGSHRTSKTQFLDMLAWKNPDLIHNMNKEVWSALNNYATKWDFFFYEIERPSAQKYGKGKEYKIHTDHGPIERPRICSAVLYLNDDFSGGETYFPSFDYKIEPKAGRLAIFPSNYVYAHAALPVTRGTKYAIAYWANG